jgi:hypothetical protein
MEPEGDRPKGKGILEADQLPMRDEADAEACGRSRLKEGPQTAEKVARMTAAELSYASTGQSESPAPPMTREQLAEQEEYDPGI